jgi:hypothetical protein
MILVVAESFAAWKDFLKYFNISWDVGMKKWPVVRNVGHLQGIARKTPILFLKGSERHEDYVKIRNVATERGFVELSIRGYTL